MVFKVLDDYEGIGDGPANHNEYIRTQVVAYLETYATMNVWFYAYNFPTDTFQQISSGRYL